MKVGNGIVTGVHTVSKVLRWVSGFSILAMAVISTLDVILRYIFKSPLSGTMELVQVLMDLFVYAGLGMAVYAGSLIAVPVLVEHLPKKVRGKVEGIGNLLCAAMSVLIFWQLAISTAKNFADPLNKVTTLLRIPYWPLYLFTLICYALICAELIIRGIGQISGTLSSGDDNLEEEIVQEEIEQAGIVQEEILKDETGQDKIVQEEIEQVEKGQEEVMK